QEEKSEKARQKTIASELEWVRQNPKGRQAKQKARLNNYEALVAQERNAKLDDVQIHIPPGERLGEHVIRADGLRKGFGDQLLIDDAAFDLPRGAIVGIIGPNGAGKTTLFKMITGSEQPDGGELSIGDSVGFAYVDQSRDALDPEKTVWEEISGGMDLIKVGDREMNSRAYCAGFNFKGSDQQKKVGALSGGMRNRVHLAKLLRSGGNVLLLDEPTNDLDVDTLRALEEALLDFPGCAECVPRPRLRPGDATRHCRQRATDARRCATGGAGEAAAAPCRSQRAVRTLAKPSVGAAGADRRTGIAFDRGGARTAERGD